MRVVVTGAAGFLGSRLCHSLLRGHHEVTAVDLVHPDDAWRLAGLAEAYGAFKYVWGSVADSSFVLFDAIVHAGAVTDVSWSRRNPQYTIENNTLATASYLSRREFKPHFIYISTHSVYGPGHSMPVAESVALNPSTLYGASKAAAEMFVKGICQEEGIPYTILRPAMMCGINERLGSLVSTFIKRALNPDLKLRIDGDGLQTREINPVENVVDAISLVAGNTKCYGQTFNVGSGHETSIVGLARMVLSFADRDWDEGITWAEARSGEEGRLALDSTRLRSFTGWQPTAQLRTVLPMMVDYYKMGGR